MTNYHPKNLKENYKINGQNFEIEYIVIDKKFSCDILNIIKRYKS